jgi:hypothetical protein
MGIKFFIKFIVKHFTIIFPAIKFNNFRGIALPSEKRRQNLAAGPEGRRQSTREPAALLPIPGER